MRVLSPPERAERRPPFEEPRTMDLLNSAPVTYEAIVSREGGIVDSMDGYARQPEATN